MAREASCAVRPENFKSLMAAWELPQDFSPGGQGEKILSKVIWEIRLRAALFLTVGLVTTIGLAFHGPLVLILPVGLASFLGVATSLWRLRVLREQRFVTFSRWLRPGPKDDLDQLIINTQAVAPENVDVENVDEENVDEENVAPENVDEENVDVEGSPMVTREALHGVTSLGARYQAGSVQGRGTKGGEQ
jgi:hypothetical protein